MLPDDRFELPVGWKGAAFLLISPFGTALSRPHPEGAFVLRRVEQKKDTALGVWDTRTGKLIHFLPNAADARWTPNGKHLVTVDEAITVTVLDWPELSMRREARLGFDTLCGVGGLELAISGTGRLGALWVYSGQSEEGYALFSLPDVETLATLPYVAGESASPCVFSPDDQHLALAVEPSAFWWAGDDEEADWDTPAKGGPVHWATLHIQETRQHGVHAEHPILVDLPRGWVPSGELQGASWPRNVRFTDAKQLVFDLPWGGSCSIAFPPKGPCLVPPPPKA